MSTIPQVSEAIHTVLSSVADEAARQTGFVRRHRRLKGSTFVQTLVLGWLGNPDASLEELTQTAAALGVDISPQGLDQRFNREAALCLEQVLSASVSQLVASESVSIPILERFSAVVIQDSSTVVLPDSLKEIWQGCGGTNSYGVSAVKLQVRWDLSTGALMGPMLEHGRSHDSSCMLQWSGLMAGGLRITDLGYFSLDAFNELDAKGAYFLSRLKVGTKLYDEHGEELELPKALGSSVDMPVQLGRLKRLRARLIALPVPKEVSAQRRRRLRDEARKKGHTPSKTRLALCDWTVLITNVPQSLLYLDEALIMMRVRWQIELLFKLWKQYGKIDEWRSAKPWRILCELYAKLVAMLIQHWILLVGFWAYPDRSMVKGAQTVRAHAIVIASAMAGLLELSLVVEQIRRCLAFRCKMNWRLKEPNTFQLLLEFAHDA